MRRITLLIIINTLLIGFAMNSFTQTYRWRMAASETEGPGVRSRPLLAYDSNKETVVMYGGLVRSNDTFDDTWEWDGNRWLQVAEEGPGVGNGAAMTYQESFEQVVLFGGLRNGNPIDDTWIWDGTSWIQLDGKGPSARYGHAMVYDPINDQIMLHGGIAITEKGEYITLHDSWMFDGMQWLQLQPDIHHSVLNNARGFHRLVFDSSTNSVFSLFGIRKKRIEASYQSQPANGYTGPFIGKWDGNEWQIFSHNSYLSPSARATAAVAYDTDRQKTVVFGGGAPFNQTEFDQGMFNDLWEWDNNVWRKMIDVENSPKPISDSRMVYDTHRKTFVLFGGVVQYKQQRNGISSARTQLNGTTWELTVSTESAITDFHLYDM